MTKEEETKLCKLIDDHNIDLYKTKREIPFGNARIVSDQTLSGIAKWEYYNELYEYWKKCINGEVNCVIMTANTLCVWLNLVQNFKLNTNVVINGSYVVGYLNDKVSVIIAPCLPTPNMECDGWKYKDRIALPGNLTFFVGYFDGEEFNLDYEGIAVLPKPEEEIKCELFFDKIIKSLRQQEKEMVKAAEEMFPGEVRYFKYVFLGNICGTPINHGVSPLVYKLSKDLVTGKCSVEVFSEEETEVE